MAKREGWYERRFVPRDTAVEVACAQCHNSMWLPPSKVERYKRCSAECTAEWRKQEREALIRPCETCGQTFRPRAAQLRIGHGRFCSQKCNTDGRVAMQQPEVKERAIATMRAKMAAGLVRRYRGEEHPQWKGGKAACVRRRIESGKAADTLRRYRRANPDKVREFKHRRDGRKIGKLPYGTIPQIRKLQRDKCAICQISLKEGSHLDHIVPLAKGGKHEPRNLQLLCKPCNLRKSDRDPITHMQSLGKLL